MPERIAAYQIEARLLRWGDSSTAGRTITLELDPDAGEVHPFKHYPSGAKHGQRFRLLFAPIADDETAAVPPAEEVAPARLNNLPVKDPSRSDRARESYRMKGTMEKAASRCAMLCKEPEFREWLCGLGTTEDHAIQALRYRLNIKSRSEIGYDERAYRAFCALEAEYLQAVGRMAEVR